MKTISPRAILYSVLLTALFSSCITARKVNLLQPPGRGIPAYEAIDAFEEYRLRVGDRLSIQVFSLDGEMNRLFNAGGGGVQTEDLFTYLVDEAGTISLPSLDSVVVVGKTLRETRDLLIELLTPFFITTTPLDVDVRRVNRFYSVIGEARSGRFPIHVERMNIFQALAQAGDVGTFGKRSKIRIIRETEEGATVITFDVRSEDIIHSRYFYIEDNDVIYIQPMAERVFGITNFTSLASTIVGTAMGGLMLFIIISGF